MRREGGLCVFVVRPPRGPLRDLLHLWWQHPPPLLHCGAMVVVVGVPKGGNAAAPILANNGPGTLGVDHHQPWRGEGAVILSDSSNPLVRFSAV